MAMTDHQPLTADKEAEIRARLNSNRVLQWIADDADRLFATIAAERARAEKAEAERDTEMVLRAKAELEGEAALETNEAVKREHLPKLVSISRERDTLQAHRDRLAGALREIVSALPTGRSIGDIARAALADMPPAHAPVDARAERLAGALRACQAYFLSLGIVPQHQKLYDQNEAALADMPAPEASPWRRIDISWVPAYSAWNDATFGTPDKLGGRGPAAHLIKEAGEARDNPGDIKEWGDCLLLVIDGSRREGFTLEQVFAAARDKVPVLMARKWGKPDADGSVEHIREVVAPPTTPATSGAEADAQPVAAAREWVVEAARAGSASQRLPVLNDALDALDAAEAAQKGADK